MKSIFEVIDQTNDEMYYPLGIYTSLEAAKNEIVNWPKDEHISEYNYEDEYETICVQERKIGMSGFGKTVLTVERVGTYNEEEDECYWKINKIVEA